VPASLKLQEEYGDDLAVLFIECQGATPDEAVAFSLRQRWYGTEAMWTSERPFNPEGSGLPACAVVSNEGKILLTGNPLAMKKQIEEAIAEQVRLRNSAPEGTPAALKKAWSDYSKGNAAAALALARKLAAEGGEDAQAAKDTEAEIVKRLEARLARIERMIESGFALEADDEIASFLKSAKGETELCAKANESKTKIGQPELDAAKALATIEKKLADKGPEEPTVKALDRLAEKHPGTKVAARAARLSQLSKVK
jgi:hypothetical protein